MNRFQPVSQVRNGAADDHAHGVIQIGRLHFVRNIDCWTLISVRPLGILDLRFGCFVFRRRVVGHYKSSYKGLLWIIYQGTTSRSIAPRFGSC